MINFECLNKTLSNKNWDKIANKRYKNPLSLKQMFSLDQKYQKIIKNNISLVDHPIYEDAIVKYLPLNNSGLKEKEYYNIFSGTIGPEIYKETILHKDLGIELVMESAGSLNNVIMDIDCREQRIEVAYQTANLLLCLEEAEIIHGDVKPGNILIKRQTNDLILTDFEYSSNYKEFKRTASKENAIKKFHGTPGYIAPELFEENFDFDDYDPISLDMFSYGNLIYNLIHKRRPNYPGIDQLNNESFEKYKQSMINERYLEFNRDLVVGNTDKKLLQIVYACTEPSPKMRPSSFNEITSLLR